MEIINFIVILETDGLNMQIEWLLLYDREPE